MSYNLPILNGSLIKIVGVFNYTKKQKNSLKKMGYELLPICLGHEQNSEQARQDVNYIKDNYYSEFAELFFSDTDNSTSPWYLDARFSVKFLKRGQEIACDISTPELYFFPNDNTGIFSLTIEVFENDFNKVSDITYCACLFDGDIVYEGVGYKFHSWISKFLLSSIPLRGEKVASDKFSGSKFKIYTIMDITEPIGELCYSRDNLLYEIGTRSKIGTLAENGMNSPSSTYYEELMKSSISVFNNYKGLSLLDSYTLIGEKIYPNELKTEWDLVQRNLHKRIYFSFYVFNLYVRYSVFRFNATFKENEVKKRNEFEDFINHYNLKHISFNFLPNIFFNKMRDSLQIELEISHFEHRLQKLADSIKEEEEKRQGFLLGLISALSSISAIEPIFGYLKKIKAMLGMSVYAFYSLVFVLMLVLILAVLFFIYPKMLMKLKQWIKNAIK